jgi:hypothetical protein
LKLALGKSLKGKKKNRHSWDGQVKRVLCCRH